MLLYDNNLLYLHPDIKGTDVQGYRHKVCKQGDYAVRWTFPVFQNAGKMRFRAGALGMRPARTGIQQGIQAKAAYLRIIRGSVVRGVQVRTPRPGTLRPRAEQDRRVSSRQSVTN